MAGPGGKEVGRVSIRVLPDTSAFRRSLDRYLDRVEKSLRVEIPVAADADGLAREVKAAAAVAGKRNKVELPTEPDATGLNARLTLLAKRLSGKDITFNVDIDRGSIGSTINRVARLGASLRTLAIPAAITAAAPSIAAIGVAAAQAAGSVALLPAALTAVVGGFAAARTAFTGFGEAMSSMGDFAKFAEALRNLSPAARDAAIGIRELRPAFGQLRLDVQQSLFERMGRTINDVATAYLPTLRAGLTNTAAALGDMAKQSGRALLRPGVITAVRVQLDQAAQAFRNMAPALGNVVAGLMHIGEAGSRFLPGLATGANRAAASFARWAKSAKESGRFAELIQASFAAIQQLGSVLGNVGSLIVGVFKAANIEGAGFLNTLDSGTERLAAFVNSAEGFTGLRQVFAGVQAAVGGVMDGLGAVLRVFVTDLGPVITELGPAVGQFARQLGTALAGALKVVAPLLLAMATFLNDNMTWLGPVIIALGSFAGALWTANKALTVYDNIAGKMQLLAGLPGRFAQIGTSFVGLVTRIGTGAATIATSIATMTRQFAVMVARATVATVQTIARFTVMAAQVTARVVAMTVQVAVRFTIMAAQATARTVSMAVGVAVRFATMAAQATARTAVMAASVAAQFAVMAARAVAHMAAMAASVVAQWARMAAGAMVRAATMAAAWVVAMGPIGWVIAAVVGLVALIIANWSRVKSFTISAWNAVTSFVAGAWRRISAAVASGVGRAVSFVRSLPGRAISALGNLGGYLWGAGADLVRGFINGVRSMIGNLMSTVRNMASSAVSTVKSWLGIGSPSKVFAELGGWTSEGFARGIERAAPHAIHAARDMADTVARTPVAAPATPTTGGGYSSADLQRAVTTGVLLALDGARMRVDGNGVARLVNKTNSINARR